MTGYSFGTYPAVNEGTEWVVLTNAVRWRIYRVVFGKPIDQELVLEFDLLGLNNKKDEDLEKIFLLAKEGWNKSALEEFETYRQALSRFVVAATLTTDPILRLVRRQLRNLAPDAKLDVDQIRTVLVQEVLKRDAIEGEKAEEARKRVSRASKPRRSKISDEAPVQAAPEAAAVIPKIWPLGLHIPSRVVLAYQRPPNGRAVCDSERI